MSTPTHLHVASDTARFEIDGLVAGGVAGANMLVTSVLLSAALAPSDGLLLPFRYAASIVMADHAFEASAPLVIAAGLGVHLSASLLFGFIFGLIASAHEGFVRRHLRTVTAEAVVLGGAAGLLAWAVDVLLIGGFFYPWFYATAGAQLLVHGLAFGIPLGIAYTRLRQRRARVGQAPTPRPNQAPTPSHPLPAHES